MSGCAQMRENWRETTDGIVAARKIDESLYTPVAIANAENGNSPGGVPVADRKTARNILVGAMLADGVAK